MDSQPDLKVELKAPDAVYKTCVRALASFVADAGFTDVVVGLSGGIDSSLAATMAADALGPEKVHGIAMPGPFSSESSLEDAAKLAENLGIQFMEAPIGDCFDAFAEAFSRATGSKLEGLAAENTQARCRMVICMALSNANGWMMLNTGNFSESALGYSTLYGDTAGAFAPLGGLLKTQVYQLANWRNGNAEKKGELPPIPQNVLDKPPSAELSPDQTDEECLGFTYEYIDKVLLGMLEQGMPDQELALYGLDANDIRSIRKRYEKYEFKRKAEPPYPIVNMF